MAFFSCLPKQKEQKKDRNKQKKEGLGDVRLASGPTSL